MRTFQHRKIPPPRKSVRRKQRQDERKQTSSKPNVKSRSEMQSVDEILDKLRLEKADLNNIGSDMIAYIFEELTVTEIFLLCSVNRIFNSICRDESLWKKKILRDYKISKKTRRTWRETAKQAYLEKGRYWYDTLKDDLNYYLIEPISITTRARIIRDYDETDPTAIPPSRRIKQFRKDFTKRALKDKKAIPATKLIFNYFYLNDLYRRQDRRHIKEAVEDFLPIFKRAAEVSPGGKIPLQWILDETLYKPVNIRKFDPDAWAVAIADKDMELPIIPLTVQDYLDYYNHSYLMNEYEIVGRGRLYYGAFKWSEDDYYRYLFENKLTKQSKYNSLERYIIPWNAENIDLYKSMIPLTILYKQHPELFFDDTKDGDNAEMGMVLMNYPGRLVD